MLIFTRWDGRDKELQMPRGTLGARGHVIPHRPNFQPCDLGSPVLLFVPINYVYGHYLASKLAALSSSRLLPWDFTQAPLILSQTRPYISVKTPRLQCSRARTI